MKVTVEFARPGRPRRRGMILGALVLALALPATALAITGTFSDVPPSSSYFAAVEAVAGAGITSGCGSGKFCPTDPITRQQEAVFVQRAGSRIAMSSTVLDSSVTGSTYNDIASVSIKVAGTTALGIGANQFVRVDGHVTVAGAGASAGCPCDYALYIVDGLGGTYGPTYATFPAATSQQSLVTSWVFPADPGVQTYTIRVYFSGSPDDVLNFYAPEISAQTVPFGANGTDSLASGPIKPVKDSTPATAGD